MSSYIPPHMRNRNKERKASWKEQKEREEEEKMKSLKNTDENFPSLGGSGSVKKTSWGGSKSFASLATEWKEHETQKKIDDERRRLHEIRTRTIVIPHSHTNITDESYDEKDDTYETTESLVPENDEWTTISKKLRPIHEKTVEELDQELEENTREHENDSMWGSNQPQEYETYWDERRY